MVEVLFYPEEYPISEGNETTWTIRHSPFSVHKEEIDLVDTDHKVDALLKRLPTFPVPRVVDLLAENDALRDIHHDYAPVPTFKGLSVSVALNISDHVDPEDEKIGITHLTGRVQDEETFTKIDQWRGDQYVQLALSFGYGSWYYTPKNRNFLRSSLSRIYNMLDPNGGIFVALTPTQRSLEKLEVPIVDYVYHLHNHGLYVRWHPVAPTIDNYSDGEETKTVHYGLFLIEKSPTYPTLPVFER